MWEERKWEDPQSDRGSKQSWVKKKDDWQWEEVESDKWWEDKEKLSELIDIDVGENEVQEKGREL